MSFRVVSDSSSNVFAIPGAKYTTVPMKIIAGQREFADVPGMDVREMVDFLQDYKGKSGTSCPNVQDWLDAFGDGQEDVIALTISGNLSGSYNSAQQAAQQFLENHPQRRAYVFDTLSTGPEQAMLADRMLQWGDEGLDFDTILEKAKAYHSSTHIFFCLESMNNLARNGRVSPAAAKIAGLLGIRVCGEAHDGRIVPVHKPRGEKKALQTLLEMMVERGLYDGALVRIAHCFALSQAQALKESVLARFPNCRFLIEPTGGLCSFYAETGGLIVGMEGGFNQVNHH